MNVQSKTRRTKRDAILRTVLRLVRDNGFHGVPISEVAAKSNVATGTIYHYFASKEDMINALFASIREKMGAALADGVGGTTGYRERFRLMWMNLYRYFTANPDEFRFLQQYQHSPFISKSTHEKVAGFYQAAGDLLKLGMAEGHLRPMDETLLLNSVYYSAVAAAETALQVRGGLSEVQVDTAEKCCWRAFRNKKDKGNS